ncbi:hypothetical protein [Corynebacterium gottingense]|uniref:Beta-N-acetylglucosaminidase n=1 Tax=Corynebacterium gottingense TaxID=2041036 RepID=A0ABX9UH12_9CORY|nr:hypothetical protein [Corynebacterium gottingense]RMD17391.1 hypothetical protein EAW56_11060 [Corynebacterium gottingense]WJZ12555.1 hypothetical protein CGOTT_02995 [Corynebacterium gottingense]
MTHRRTLVPALLAASLALTACGNGDDETSTTAAPAPEETETAQSEAPSSSATSSTAESTESTGSTVSSASSTSKESGTRASTSTSAKDKTVQEVTESFAGLAPESLFAQLDTCSATGVSGSYDCSGAEIGQFQFFDSEAKAASTTQLLTELRSSRIVEDDGERIVGWSTLGTSAIITVVDNQRGQVMQQLVSSEQEDPRERIEKLGLADVEAEGETTADSPASTTRTSAAATTTQR